MKDFQIISNPQVEQIFNNYPNSVRSKMLKLRELIIKTAQETERISRLEETLKWGEPGYLTKYGSTLRMDLKAKTPNKYAMYFQCTSRLVTTFRVMFKNTFNFEGERAIIFSLEEEIVEPELKLCIKAALSYHKVKHLPSLGI